MAATPVPQQVATQHPDQPSGDGALSVLRRAVGIRNSSEKAMVDRYAQWVQYALKPGSDLTDVPLRLQQAAAQAKLKDVEIVTIRRSAIAQMLNAILADDLVTEEEDEWANSALAAIGVDTAWLSTFMADATVEIMTARANSGRLEPIDDPQLMTKPGELVYLEVVASKTKQVTVKEYRAGYAGVSYRISKNMRVQTGGARGRMVPVGTETAVEDSGVLSITDRRAVFAGAKKTQEFLYDKLVGLSMFEEGLTLGVSNRQSSSSFQVDYPQLVAATIGAAYSKTGNG